MAAKLERSRTNLVVFPGIRDNMPDIVRSHEKLMRRYANYGISSEVVPVGWRIPGRNHLQMLDASDDSVTDVLDRASGKVSLLGTSSGGVMALNVFMEHPDEIDKVVILASRLSSRNFSGYAQGIDQPFLDAIDWLNTNESDALSSEMRSRVLTLRPEFGDRSVPVESSFLPGANNYEVLFRAEDHVSGIRTMLQKYPVPIATFINGGDMKDLDTVKIIESL